VRSSGATVATELSTQVGQASFSADIARLQQTNPDTVFLYMHETETGRFLQQAQAAGLQAKMRFLGASSALAQSTVQLAGPAADGVQGFVPYSASAPSMTALAKLYQDAHGGAAPDHNYFKGYVAMWMVAYASQDVGNLDQKALVADLHSKVFCVSKYPHLLESTKWGKYGDVDRSTFAVKIANGHQTVVDTIPPLNPGDFASCG
jgi:branched-chain amino acid transport system substrate-binding protein